MQSRNQSTRIMFRVRNTHFLSFGIQIELIDCFPADREEMPISNIQLFQNIISQCIISFFAYKDILLKKLL